MNDKEITIGELIKDEVLNQKWVIEDFTDAIGCQRTNFYKVIKKNNLDIQLIKKISQVLNHNFFQDLADNYKLADLNETAEERENRENFAFFLSNINNILKQIGKNEFVTIKKWEKGNDPVPDGGFPFAPITFTIGETYEHRAGGPVNGMIIETVKISKYSFEFISNIWGSKWVNFSIDKKTEIEWKEFLGFIFKFIEENNCKVALR